LPFPAAYDRRRFLSGVGVAAAGLFTTPGAFAEALASTPRQTEGPFFPDKLPLDTDNDLIILNDSITPAVGEVTYLSGRILGPNGAPIRGATIEIWQCDANGVYLHGGSFGGHEKQDKNFQGYGRFLTASSGEYLFRTIKPVPYTGRTPHIHAKVRVNGRELLTTQVYVKGQPGNDKDMLYNRLSDDKARQSLTADFAPLAGAPVGVLAARWDIVLGATPSDDEHSKHEHTPPERPRPRGPGLRNGSSPSAPQR
ncbi:MAG TPA: protocatechuate 3,4-dioxygenase, partial [Prosthecobacter sp.]|nr:protocatechuate 3,4-dioxygenase [Prosthecobacter sp.]